MSELNNLNGRTGKLRFWCQKVLPLVYDDSLSYYELLCKVVAKLNEVIDNSGELRDIALEEVDRVLIEWLENGTLDVVISESISTLKKRRFIFISDSYGTYLNEANINFVGVIKNALRLPDTDCYDIHLGSSGFTRPDAQKWLNMLQGTDIDSAETITDIWCVGGANDVLESYENNVSAIGEFVNYCAVTYPNAIVHLAHVGLTFTPVGMTNRFNRSLKAYRECASYGAVYVPNSEYVLCNNTLLLGDLVHPNNKGVDVVGRQIVNAIRCGQCDVHYWNKPNVTIVTPTTSIASALEMKLDNNNCSMLATGGGVFFDINLDATTFPIITRDFLVIPECYCVGGDVNQLSFECIATCSNADGVFSSVACLYPTGVGDGGVHFGLVIADNTKFVNVTRLRLNGGCSTVPADL